jgi:hypothetical protein
MGDDTVSAIPGQLIGWAAWARQAAPSLERAARDLNLAIEELNLSRGDLAVLGQVPFLGDDLLAYAARNLQTDEWVGQVGQAFLRVATRGLPPGLVRANYQDLLKGVVETSFSEIASQVGGDPTSAAGPIPADPQARAAWWATLTADQQAMYLEYAAPQVAYLATPEQLQAAGYSSLQDVYFQQALQLAGIDLSKWQPSRGVAANVDIERKVYAFYQEMWDGDPSLQWAGLAKLVGGEVFGYLGSLEAWKRNATLAGWLLLPTPFGGVASSAALAADNMIPAFEVQFMRVQKTIFDDMSWQLVAYEYGGLPAIQALARAGSIDPFTETAWEDIASGDPARVSQGNLRLAYHEQRVAQGIYTAMKSMVGGQVVDYYINQELISPVPGARSFHAAEPNGDFMNYTDRMNWTANDMWPAYQRLLADPAKAQQLIDAPLDQLAQGFSLSPIP